LHRYAWQLLEVAIKILLEEDEPALGLEVTHPFLQDAFG
jgi:hypothetical protein